MMCQQYEIEESDEKVMEWARMSLMNEVFERSGKPPFAIAAFFTFVGFKNTRVAGPSAEEEMMEFSAKTRTSCWR